MKVEIEEVGKVKVGLCSGRHSIPGVNEYIFVADVSPVDFAGMQARVYDWLIGEKIMDSDGNVTNIEINVFVTGLTAAMLTVFSVCVAEGIDLVAWHYDRDVEEYKPQRLNTRPY